MAKLSQKRRRKFLWENMILSMLTIHLVLLIHTEGGAFSMCKLTNVVYFMNPPKFNEIGIYHPYLFVIFLLL